MEGLPSCTLMEKVGKVPFQSSPVSSPSFINFSASLDLDIAFVAQHLNFYRIHLLFFTFLPLIASGIFYASNGQNKIAYIDCLFLCFSAMTVCGLTTVLFADLTVWQEVILFVRFASFSPNFSTILTIYALTVAHDDGIDLLCLDHGHSRSSTLLSKTI